MKKVVFLVISLAILFTSCDTLSDSGSDDVPVYSPLPEGVYIAGFYRVTNNNSSSSSTETSCYWVGDRRIDLNIGIPGSISVSDGRVLVLSPTLFEGKSYYWVDGTRYEHRNFPNRKVVINKGKIYQLENRDVWIDGIKETIREGVDAYDMAVSGGYIYLSGIWKIGYSYYDVGYIYKHYSSSRWSSHDICRNTEEFTFIPIAITATDEGKVYVAGYDSYYNHTKAWYYTDGDFFELEGFGKTDQITRITAYGGSFFVYKNNIDYPTIPIKDVSYWVDGKKVTIDFPANFNVTDFVVMGGKTYIVGYYITMTGNVYQTQACYWVDGVRYDLDGSMATAVFVEE